MNTIVSSASTETIISAGGSVTLIGEKINPTGRKRLASAMKDRDLGYIRALARQQVAAGAEILDINVGVPGLDEKNLLPEVVRAVTAEVDWPLCIDTANTEALAAALAVADGRAGATCIITDAGKLGLGIRAAELLLGRDEYAGKYLSLFRTQQKQGS
jgi:5-methyltetrahydrofolate--homocysteine methyltransferase